MRSVSFTRQLAMLPSRLLPSANSAVTASHRRVGDVIEIQVESLQPTLCRCARFDPVLSHLDACTHSGQRRRKLHIALDAVAAHTFHPHRSAADRAGSEKVRRARGIPLDEDFPGTVKAAVGRNRERGPARAAHLHAEPRHEVERDLDVGFGNQIADDFDRRLLAGQRQRHQQRSQELAGNLATHPHLACIVDISSPDFQRREALLPQVADVGAELAQRVHQVADRTLMHSRYAG
jgi:hypothetical protein